MGTNTGLRVSMNLDADWSDTATLIGQVIDCAEKRNFTATCRANMETDEAGMAYCDSLLLGGKLIFRTENLNEHIPDGKMSRVTLGDFSGAVVYHDHLVFVRYGPNTAFFVVWAARPETARARCEEIAVKLPPPLQSEDPKLIKVHFWCNSAHGPRFYPRTIECPNWDDIKSNYHGDVIGEMEWLQKLHRPDDHGRIIIWSGDPGTGKTWAIRSLILSLKQRARIDVRIIIITIFKIKILRSAKRLRILPRPYQLVFRLCWFQYSLSFSLSCLTPLRKQMLRTWLCYILLVEQH